MSCRIKITFCDGVIQTDTLSLKELSVVIKKSSMHQKRSVMPTLPWLIDHGFDLAAEKFNKSAIKRMDVEEKVTI